MTYTDLLRSSKLCKSCFQPSAFNLCVHCDPKGIKCNSCNNVFKTFKDFSSHIDTTHFEMKTSPIKKPKMSTSLSCEIRIKKERKVLLYVCPSCKSIYPTFLKLKLHITRIHLVKRFQCSHCDKKFASKRTLAFHLRLSNQQKVKCEKCGLHFASNMIEKHLSNHTNVKIDTYLCSLCDKRFKYLQSLTRHIKEHTSEKCYKCQECGKSFLHNYGLKRHEKCHTVNEFFYCAECEKKYRYKHDLVRHILTHSSNFGFTCSVCQKTFARKSYFVEHQMHHSQEKMYLCFCGKAFKFKSCLSRHKSKHKQQT